jgi:hypothetical protein
VCGERGERKYLNEMGRIGTSTASITPCVGARKGSCNCAGRWTSSSLWPPSLPGQVTSSVLSRSGRRIDPPRDAKIASILLPWSGFFEGGLSDEGMHVPNRISRSFCTCGPTDRLIGVLPYELIRCGRTRASPLPLGFNSLFLNQPLPWRALCPAFQILSTIRKCSFSLEIYWASKSTT